MLEAIKKEDLKVIEKKQEERKIETERKKKEKEAKNFIKEEEKANNPLLRTADEGKKRFSEKDEIKKGGKKPETKDNKNKTQKNEETEKVFAPESREIEKRTTLK